MSHRRAKTLRKQIRSMTDAGLLKDGGAAPAEQYTAFDGSTRWVPGSPRNLYQESKKIARRIGL